MNRNWGDHIKAKQQLPRRTRREAMKINPLIDLLSFLCKPGEINRQNSHKI